MCSINTHKLGDYLASRSEHINITIRSLLYEKRNCHDKNITITQGKQKQVIRLCCKCGNMRIEQNMILFFTKHIFFPLVARCSWQLSLAVSIFHEPFRSNLIHLPMTLAIISELFSSSYYMLAPKPRRRASNTETTLKYLAIFIRGYTVLRERR